MIDYFSETLFDPGINLNHPPKFEELITKKISESKTGIIEKIFQYKGISELEAEKPKLFSSEAPIKLFPEETSQNKEKLKE